MAQYDAEALGRDLIRSMRYYDNTDDNDPRWVAVDLLRWGAEQLDDETLWRATLTAVELASNDQDRWALGDGVIDESIATRPSLQKSWRAAYETNEHVRAVYRVMHEYLDSNFGERGWWAL